MFRKKRNERSQGALGECRAAGDILQEGEAGTRADAAERTVKQ